MLRRDEFSAGGLRLGAAAVGLLAAMAMSGCAGAGKNLTVGEQSVAPAGPTTTATAPSETVVENRLVVVYASGVVPEDVAARVTAAGGELREVLVAMGMVVVECAPGNSANVMAALQADASVSYVLHDRVMQAHRILIAPEKIRMGMKANAIASPNSTAPPNSGSGGSSGPTTSASEGDMLYSQTPQGWAVVQAGGYGGGIANGSGAPAHGAWDVTMGAGVRIAVLDTGVDEAHPDIAPNLAVNLSEVNTAELPTACDDGTPWDQTGHGTWVASLATAAAGPTTGEVIGMAPQATLINIKVMEREPATAGASDAASCEAGQGGGLLSWVIAGINDAMQQRAQVIVLSLGTLVDLDTGDGAGWQTTFNSVTYKAFASGVVMVASAGNDGFDLSNGRYIELPAQARDVLPVVASTNAACAENAGTSCVAGPVTLASYSNFGETLGAVAAPGGGVPEGSDTGVSGYVRGACSNGEAGTVEGMPAAGESFGCFGLGHQQYVQAIGTSASAPLAAGVAALVMAAHPTWSAVQVVKAMEATATPGAGNFNYGAVNAEEAVK